MNQDKLNDTLQSRYILNMMHIDLGLPYLIPANN